MKPKHLRLLVSSIVLTSSAHAIEVNAIAGGDWTLPATWSNAAAASSGNNYTIDGFTVVSPTGSNTVTFPGDLITLSKTGATAGVLDLARLHSSTTQTVTTTLSDIVISDGATLQFRASTGSNVWNVGSATDITTSGTVLINNTGGGYGQDINFSGTISGSGTLQYKTANSGNATGTIRTLSLKSAASAYTGNWFVQHVNSGDDFGALRADAANALGTGVVTLDTRARLINNVTSGLDSLTGVTLNQSTSTFELNSRDWTNASGVLTVTNGTLNAGTGTVSIASMSQAAGTINLSTNGATNGKLTTSGNANFTGGSIVVTPLSNPTGQTYDLVIYGGSLVAAPTIVTAGDIGRLGFTVNNGSGTNDKVSITFTGTGANLVWTGSTDSNWDNNVTQNFTNGGSPDTFRNFDNVLFDGSTAATSPLLVGGISAGTVTFNSTSDYTLAGAGSLVGSTALVKSGTGTLTLSNTTANTFTGNVTISGGTLKAGSTTALGAAVVGTSTDVSGGGTLDVNALNLGSELVKIAGAGVGDNGAIVNSGASQTQALRFVTLTGDASIGGANRWDIRGNSTATLNLASHKLTKVGANYIALVATNVTDGDIDVNAGTLSISTTTTVNGTGTIKANTGGTLEIGYGATAANVTRNLVLNGGALTSASTASGANSNISLTADSSLSGGTLTLGGAISESGGSYGATVTGMILNLNGSTGFTGGLLVGPTSTGVATVTFSAASPLGVASGKEIRLGNNTGGGGTSAQTLNIDGAVTDAGSLYVGRVGVLNIRNGATWSQSGTTTIQGQGGYTGTMNVQAGATFTSTSTNTIKVSGADANGGQALLSIDGSFITASGFEQITTPTTGYAQVNLRNDGTLKLTADVLALTTNVRFVLSAGVGNVNTNGFNTTLTGTTLGKVTGTGSLVKQGDGTLTLNGAIAHTGDTTVNGGTLAGTGNTASSLTVQTGAALAPGTGIGTFGSKTATFDAGSTYKAEINSASATADKLNAFGDVTLTAGSFLNVTDIGAPSTLLTVGTKLTLIDYTGFTLTGIFSGVPDGSEISAGANRFLVSYHDGSTLTLTANGAASVTPFGSWALSKGLDGTPGKEAGFDDDPEGDGIANGLEWILDGNPLGQDASSLVTTTATAAGGLTLAFNRKENSIGQATLTVEYDTDLAGPWTSFATVGATSSGPVTINTVPDPDAVSVTIPASNAIGGKLFGRLKATRP